MQGIISENVWVKASAMHVEAVLPERFVLSASAFTDDSEFVLESADSLTVNDVLRQTVIDIDVTKNRSVVQLHVMSNVMSSAV